MFAFIIRRIIQAIMVMLVISFIGFSVQHNLGDPVRDMVGERVSVAEREALRDKLGLNDPFLTQYFRFVNKCTGNGHTLTHPTGKLFGVRFLKSI